MWATVLLIAGIALALGSKEAAGGFAALSAGIFVITMIVGMIF